MVSVGGKETMKRMLETVGPQVDPKMRFGSRRNLSETYFQVKTRQWSEYTRYMPAENELALPVWPDTVSFPAWLNVS